MGAYSTKITLCEYITQVRSMTYGVRHKILAMKICILWQQKVYPHIEQLGVGRIHIKDLNIR